MSQGNVTGKRVSPTADCFKGNGLKYPFYTYQNNEIYLNGNSNAVGGSSLTNVTYQ